MSTLIDAADGKPDVQMAGIDVKWNMAHRLQRVLDSDSESDVESAQGWSSILLRRPLRVWYVLDLTR